MTNEAKEAMQVLREHSWDDAKIARAFGVFLEEDVREALTVKPRPEGEAEALRLMNERLKGTGGNNRRMP